MVTRVPNLRKWFIRSFMLFLVLGAYGGTAVGNRILIKVAEATQSEAESFVFHETTEPRRESFSPNRHRERHRSEIDRDHAHPDFRRHGRLWFVNEDFSVRENSGPSCPPRAPPVLS